jgi:uncharacterized surface protein with fasciclin (FAS1) repeats
LINLLQFVLFNIYDFKKMTKNKQLILISLFLVLFLSCRKDAQLKYERPTWLAGKLYAQIKTKPELSTFAELLHVSGYDTIINVSGSYTVFAPSNDAFALYFQGSPNYKKVSDIPKAEVLKLVKYHIVQNAWSKKQLTSIDIYGWIDTLDLKNNLPKGYKQQTLLEEKNKLYGIAWSKFKGQNSTINRTNIIDTTATSWHRRAFTDSRKYAPIFFKQYFDIYNLSTSDFAFYFGRQFQAVTDLYYVAGRIITDELFAENGFVYVIDRVNDPLDNGAEILADNSKGNSYSSYLNLVNQFSEFAYNETETNKQPGAAQGLRVDSLFNVTYPQLVFDITSELTKAPQGTFGLPSNVTIRYHQGIVAPTNDALNQLVNQYLAGGNNWGSIDAAPENVKRIIANSCLSINPVYETDLRNGFLNGESDVIKVDESTIVQKQYGSNCTFIGVNQPIVPRAFSSVSGPIYTRKGFSKVMFAIEKAGLLSALKRKDANYSFYVEPDNLSSVDSSLIYDPVKDRFSVATLYPGIKITGLNNTDLRILLLNHIALDQPKGIARKEFIKNLAGNYLIYNNVTKEVKGTGNTTYGYRGSKTVVDIPQLISTNADNGSTYQINSWFTFSINDIFSTISVQYPKFHALIRKAGLSQDNLSKYSFMSDNQSYTVLVPTDSVMNAISTVTAAMTTAQLQNFVLMHFIQGSMIFTDGNMSAGYYETARIDESSTPFSTVFTRIKVVPGIDQITIPAKDGSPSVVVHESAKTNILTARSLSTTGLEAFTNCVNNGVIHEIKMPLLFSNVDTN